MPTDAGTVWRSIRQYQRAAATVTVGDKRFEPALRPEHCLIACEAGKQAATLFSPAGCLAREELETIDVQGNSFLLDRLLPEKPVAVGDDWPHSEPLMAALLGLDEVVKSTVTSTLKEVTDKVARFEFAGKIEGAIYGVSTQIEVKGRYRFDRLTQRIDWFAMLVREERQSSYVEDGVDVTARLQVLIAPQVDEPAALAAATLAKVTLKPTADLTGLNFELPGGGCRFQHDRRWYARPPHAKTAVAVLRLLDRGAPLGQCNVSLLARQEPDKLTSLDKFQEDVKKALGTNFGAFVETNETTDEQKHRVLRVVVDGTVAAKPDDVPIRWIYYHISDPQGRQVSLTFTVEKEAIKRFADADKPILASLRLEDPKKGEDPQQKGEGGGEKGD
jgi:hypothetical protein